MKAQSVSRGWMVRQVLFWLGLALMSASVLVLSFASGYDLKAGVVAPRDIRSPVDITYISAIRSRQAQLDAERQVSPVYTSPDPQVARLQLDRLRQVLSFLSAVRADDYAANAQKYAWILAVPELKDLPQSTANTLLILSEADWNRVQLESLGLLDQIMRQTEIRQEDLSSIRERIPALVPLDLPPDQGIVVGDTVRHFLQPNVFYDETATEGAKLKAREDAGEAFRTLRSGQVIVREGSIITEQDIEALEQLGLASEHRDWIDMGAPFVLAGVLSLGLGLYIWRITPDILDASRQEFLLLVLLLLFLLLARLLIPSSGDLLLYLVPGAALAMLIAITLNRRSAFGAIVYFGVISGWIAGRSLGFAVLVTMGGLIAILTLPRYEQMGSIFRSGILAGIVEAVVLFVFSASESVSEPFVLLAKVGVCFISGMISGGLTVGGLFLLTPLFDLTTTFRLVELSSPNHPLLQRLLREAPATFNHVMMVTSLAEQAAERIGANALLTRVGTYYHDIGKLSRPYFFVENQQGLSNPHDRLDPYTSVDILKGHVRDGLRLARRYRLPARVQDFIPEHHGTMKVSFFYRKAVEAAGGEPGLVDESQFRYPGPAPRSKETLLVMLADGCEAATRANRPSTPEDLAKVVDSIFEARRRDGQMANCPITMQDLSVVRNTYVELLRGAFHPRVKYPDPKKDENTDDTTETPN